MFTNYPHFCICVQNQIITLSYKGKHDFLNSFCWVGLCYLCLHESIVSQGILFVTSIMLPLMAFCSKKLWTFFVKFISTNFSYQLHCFILFYTCFCLESSTFYSFKISHLFFECIIIPCCERWSISHCCFLLNACVVF